MKKMILAVPKGRILNELSPILTKANIIPEKEFYKSESRKLMFKTSVNFLDIIRVRSFDVATFVAFGAAHLGAMAFLTKHVPKEISATGQSLYYTLIGGIFSGCMLPLAGKLYSDLSGSAFFIMSCFAGCSLISLLVLSRIVRHDFKAIKG